MSVMTVNSLLSLEEKAIIALHSPFESSVLHALSSMLHEWKGFHMLKSEGPLQLYSQCHTAAWSHPFGSMDCGRMYEGEVPVQIDVKGHRILSEPEHCGIRLLGYVEVYVHRLPCWQCATMKMDKIFFSLWWGEFSKWTCISIEVQRGATN